MSQLLKRVRTMTLFPLLQLQQCVPTMTLCHAGCLVPRKNETDTDTRGLAHTVFLAHAKACYLFR
jgi:hypothetical protein